MKQRRTLTIALAAVLAFAGAVAVLVYVHQANNRAVAGLKAAQVIIAKTLIPAGTSLHAAQAQGLISSEKVPIASIPPSAVLSVTAQNERLVVSAAVQPGQLLLQPMLETAAQVTGGVAIPPGMVAVSIEVCLPAAVAGYVSPGSDVAVFDTYPVKQGKGTSSAQVQETCNVSHTAQTSGTVATEIVLPRVEVISVGTGGSQAASSGAAFGGGSSANSVASAGAMLVTFAVSQADAERLITIEQTGLPYLALLTPSSKTAFDTGPVTLFRLP